MVDAPDAERQRLAQMAEDDGESGESVEQAAGHQAQRVGGGLDGEGPHGAEQFRVTLVDSLVARQGVARMQVDRHAECLGAFPERQEALVVVVPAGGGVTDVGEAVEHHAGKPELSRAAVELGRGRNRVLHGQGREPAVAGGTGGNDLGQRVVDLPGAGDGTAWIGLRLDPGRGQARASVAAMRRAAASGRRRSHRG